MALDLAALIAALEAEYLANQMALAAARGRTSFSEQGRSQTVDLNWLLARQKAIRDELAGLGFAIGSPTVFAVSSVVRA